jgi:hypothetical protein
MFGNESTEVVIPKTQQIEFCCAPAVPGSTCEDWGSDHKIKNRNNHFKMQNRSIKFDHAVMMLRDQAASYGNEVMYKMVLSK